MNLEEAVKLILGRKDTLEEKDLALWLFEVDGVRSTYVYIVDITRDTSRNVGEWWHVTFHVIAKVPSVRRTLILRTEQMTGAETFTVDGQKMAFLPIDLSKDAAFQDKMRAGKVKPAPVEAPMGGSGKTTLRVVK